jgi:hypothetical protein
MLERFYYSIDVIDFPQTLSVNECIDLHGDFKQLQTFVIIQIQ